MRRSWAAGKGQKGLGLGFREVGACHSGEEGYLYDRPAYRPGVSYLAPAEPGHLLACSP